MTHSPSTAQQPRAPEALSDAAPGSSSGSAVPLTHACVRCGAPVALERALCEACNPLGLSQPASSQVHGIAILGVGIAVLLLAFLARLSLSGIGPFEGRIVDVKAAGEGLAITLTVENAGDNAGQSTCRVTDPAARFGGASAYILTPRIEPGSTLTFESEVRQLGATVRVLAIECSGP